MIPASLPDLEGLDPEALKALLIAKHLESLEQHKSDTEQIEHLKLVIEKYRRMIFGRKSEKLTGELEQLEFRLEELETAQAATEATRPSSTQADSKRRSRPARRPLRHGPSTADCLVRDCWLTCWFPNTATTSRFIGSLRFMRARVLTLIAQHWPVGLEQPASY